MNISKNGIDLIKNFEGLSLKAYKCPAGVLTIGYGHTGKDVFKEQKITEKEAENLLIKDLIIHANNVNNLINVPLTQNQFDAIISFEYNIGINAFKNSTLLKLLNKKRYLEASNEFDKWIYCNKMKSKGLINRRKKEKELFLKK